MALPILHGPSNQLFFFFKYKQANFIQKKAIEKIRIEYKRATDLMSTPKRAFSRFGPLFGMLSQSSDPHVPPVRSFLPFRKGSQSSSPQSPSQFSVLCAPAWHFPFKVSCLCQEVRVCLVYAMCSTSKYNVKKR